jgi:hypothetical protein
LLAILLVSALTACTPIQAPAATEGAAALESTPRAQAAEEAVPAADAEAVVPLDPGECGAIQMALAERLSVELTMAESDFSSDIAGRQGTACTLTATGTGEDFGNFIDTAQAIREVLQAEGWEENQNYLADGPTGTASGFEKADKLAFVSVNWEPSEDAECPDDQPISDCDLESSQQLFTVVIELVQAG